MSVWLSFLAGIIAQIVAAYLKETKGAQASKETGRLEAERDQAAAAARTADAMAQADGAVRPGAALDRLRNGQF